MIKIDKGEIKSILKTDYDLGNSVLYKLCSDNFTHDTVDKILAKTLLIGKSYAVALDRGRHKSKTKSQKKKSIGDDFYQKKIIPIFIKSKIDKLLADLKKHQTVDNIEKEILYVHYHLTSRLTKINGEDKRSFSSKYLHFHLPSLFFLYDSRAKSAIDKIVKLKDIKPGANKKADGGYKIFFAKAQFLQNKIYKETEINVTPRQLDNYLLKLANGKLRDKMKTR